MDAVAAQGAASVRSARSEWWASVRVFMRTMLRRRATVGAFLALSGLLVVIAATSYDSVRESRRLEELAQDPTISIDPNVGLCSSEGPCFHVTTSAKDAAGIREAYQAYFSARTEFIEDELSITSALKVRSNALGSGLGVALFALLGATLIGAEWRWSTLHGKLAIQPRRTLLLSTQMVALCAVVSGLAIGALLLVSAFDEVMRLVLGQPAGGGAGWGDALGYVVRAITVVVVAGVIAASVASVFRSSLGGVAGAAIALAVDGWVAQRVAWFTDFSIAQQVLGLLDSTPLYVPDGIVWWRPVGITECVRGSCTSVPAELNDPSIAGITLLAWGLVIVVISIAWGRSRDFDPRQ